LSQEFIRREKVLLSATAYQRLHFGDGHDEFGGWGFFGPGFLKIGE
jgi:hypothetical protein